MNTRRTVFVLLMASLYLIQGCSPWYGIKNSTNPLPDFSSYNKIYVGWMDLGKDNWNRYGYADQKEWVRAIKDLNHASMPYYLRKRFPDKAIIVQKSENENITSESGLLIKFSKSKYYQLGNTDGELIYLAEGVKAKDDTLETTMQFIDLKTKKELYEVTLMVNADVSMASFGFSLERRMDNAAYYISRFIAKKVINH
jgi:hypothetical protein